MPQTWNEFVKEIQLKDNISRKEAMKKASPLWRKMKIQKRNSKIKDVPEISEFPKIKKKKPTKKKPKKGRHVPATLAVRASQLGGNIDIHKPPSKRNKHQRLFKKHIVLEDSAFKYLARKVGL